MVLALHSVVKLLDQHINSVIIANCHDQRETVAWMTDQCKYGDDP